MIAGVLASATAKLRAAGVESPQREARLLLSHTLGVRQEAVLAEQIPSPDAAALGRFHEAVERRSRREPLAYILGRREFWSLDFVVGPGVLVPRPESETLVEEALRHFPDPNAPLRALDLGTGSGCLLLAFLSERNQAEGVGVDISAKALAYAARNARDLGLADRSRFLLGDWMAPISGRFDVIFINPPYIGSAELSGLDREVSSYEPVEALDGGTDGLGEYRTIAKTLPLHLNAQGFAFVEIGQGQSEAVAGILEDAGLSIAGTVADLACIPRCLVAAGKSTGAPRKKELAMRVRSG